MNKRRIQFAAAATAAIIAATAADIPLAWNASPTLGVTNYVLYASTNTLSSTNLSTANVRINVGTNLAATAYDIKPGKWSFTVTAMKDVFESAPSNVLIGEVPEPASDMRTVIVEFGITVTNFVDVGFFKLRLP